MPQGTCPPSWAALLSYEVYAKQQGDHHQPMSFPSFWWPRGASGTSGTGPAFLWAVERTSECFPQPCVLRVPAPRGSTAHAALPGRGAPTGAGGSSLEPEPRASDTMALCPANVSVLSGPAPTAPLDNVPAHQSLPPSTSGWCDNAHDPGPTSWITHCAAPPRCQGAQGYHADPRPSAPDLNWQREAAPNLSSNADDN